MTYFKKKNFFPGFTACFGGDLQGEGRVDFLFLLFCWAAYLELLKSHEFIFFMFSRKGYSPTVRVPQFDNNKISPLPFVLGHDPSMRLDA